MIEDLCQSEVAAVSYVHNVIRSHDPVWYSYGTYIRSENEQAKIGTRRKKNQKNEKTHVSEFRIQNNTLMNILFLCSCSSCCFFRRRGRRESPKQGTIIR